MNPKDLIQGGVYEFGRWGFVIYLKKIESADKYVFIGIPSFQLFDQFCYVAIVNHIKPL